MQFERFYKRFLTHDPEWSTQVNKILAMGCLARPLGPDKGIDLIFEDHNGDLIGTSNQSILFMNIMNSD
jgi:hypothetical protein